MLTLQQFPYDAIYIMYKQQLLYWCPGFDAGHQIMATAIYLLNHSARMPQQGRLNLMDQIKADIHWGIILLNENILKFKL